MAGNEEESGYAAPMPCAVCEHVCPVVLLADLEVAEVCELCMPVVVSLVTVRRNGANAGDDAMKRAVEVARELDQRWSGVEAARTPPEAR